MKTSYQTVLISCLFMSFGCGLPSEENVPATKIQETNHGTSRDKQVLSIDKLDPFSAGCFSTASVISQADYLGMYYVQLWYSCKCKTYWAVARTPGAPLLSISATVQPFFGAGAQKATKVDTSYVNTEMMSDRDLDAQAYANFEYGPSLFLLVSTPFGKVPPGLCF